MRDIAEAAIIIVVMNGLGFLWAFTRKTESLTDLIYSLSFLVVAAWGYFRLTEVDWGQGMVFGMVTLWAGRLGIYLFRRIHAMGKDDRFDEMRESLTSLGGFWFFQALTILIVSLPFIFYLNRGLPPENLTLTYVGTGIWLVGFVLETVADFQKFSFKQNPANKGKFMRGGLWDVVQHPNYLGEMLVWIGVFIACLPGIRGPEWIGILSPLWVIVILIFVSGIPMLQESWSEKYGDDPEFQKHQKNTSKLIPYIY
ncbi:MAG: DUF1295 domain-containing protein [Candidatus Eisenbacteria bacterium]|uniref:DUF1295 domain-containing protein n=1 Tax=Eiseniibacteriota bacterium TaxID=2212470 RepID=A0A7Y2H343_UNCEI|nr:DUF1295 domain-containing protein [Candidatus Eisenbacteria bacterium]